jgi:nitric oxide reductase activation protein
MTPESRQSGSRLESPPEEIIELRDRIAQLPARERERLQGALDRAVSTSSRRRRILNMVQETLAQLRLDMKYLLFDLEATRRERDQLREKLDGKG